MSYPLYDKLAERALADPHPVNMLNLATAINRNPEIHEIIASLMIHHDVVQKGGIAFSGTPYYGKEMSGGTLFRIKEIPPVLQQILNVLIEDISL